MKSIFFSLDGTDADRQKLQWIVSLRLKMQIGVILFTFLGIKYDYLRTDKMVLFFSAIFFSLMISLTSYFIWKKGIKIGPSFIFLQLLLDLGTFSALIASSGGMQNPFSAVIYLHALLGGIILEFSFSVIYLGSVIFALAYIQYLTVMHLDFRTSALLPTFLAQYFVTMTAWVLARSVQRHLSLSFQKINDFKLSAERIDRLRSIGALVAGLSHEFASPLNTVKIQLERIRRKNQKPSEGGEHEILAKAVERCSDVLKRMNSIRLDGNSYESEHIDLEELLTEITEVWKADYHSTEIKLNVGSEHKVHVPVMGFTQMILNLLDNANQAAKENAVIGIDSQILNEETTLSISDNGEGFTADVISRFGEPFNSTKIGGTGLGLYSSLLFMNSIGGTLSVKNKSDHSGAVVTMFFPVRRML